MGSYGIGIERAMATIVETHYDDKGIIWPVSVAPFHAVITIVQMKNAESVQVANELYESMTNSGIDVLIDDRDARAGVKFADAELIGIPVRITVGPKGIADGVVEVTTRKNSETNLIKIKDVISNVSDLLRAYSSSTDS